MSIQGIPRHESLGFVRFMDCEVILLRSLSNESRISRRVVDCALRSRCLNACVAVKFSRLRSTLRRWKALPTWRILPPRTPHLSAALPTLIPARQAVPPLPPGPTSLSVAAVRTAPTPPRHRPQIHPARAARRLSLHFITLIKPQNRKPVFPAVRNETPVLFLTVRNSQPQRIERSLRPSLPRLMVLPPLESVD